MMSTSYGKTLRLHMPQWQGGNMHDYYFGSKLLAFLAPPPDGPRGNGPCIGAQTGRDFERRERHSWSRRSHPAGSRCRGVLDRPIKPGDGDGK
jgi:hypothetical protein